MLYSKLQCFFISGWLIVSDLNQCCYTYLAQCAAHM